MMNPSVKVISFPEIKNAYIVISAHKKETANGVGITTSFCYGGKTIGAEWEPNNGPITVLTSCTKNTDGARPHWFYDYCVMDWTQLGVKRNYLPEAFMRGDYLYIFSVLKRFAMEEEEEE